MRECALNLEVRKHDNTSEINGTSWSTTHLVRLTVFYDMIPPSTVNIAPVV